MDWDEVRPVKRVEITIGENLETLSVSELEARIAALQNEIERVTAEISRKRAHGAAASAIFKS